jgi:hypothetical protein
MRKTVLAILGALLITGSAAQIAVASEHHARKVHHGNFRGAYNQLNARSYANPGPGYGWTPGAGYGFNWRDAAKFEPAGD